MRWQWGGSVIPVYNEQRDHSAVSADSRSMSKLTCPIRARITLADNASTDDTLAVAHRLAKAVPDVDVIHLDTKGRGDALRRTLSNQGPPKW